MAGLPSLSNQQLSDVVPGIGTAIGNGTGTHQSPASLIFAQVPEVIRGNERERKRKHSIEKNEVMASRDEEIKS